MCNRVTMLYARKNIYINKGFKKKRKKKEVEKDLFLLQGGLC